MHSNKTDEQTKSEKYSESVQSDRLVQSIEGKICEKGLVWKTKLKPILGKRLN